VTTEVVDEADLEPGLDSGLSPGRDGGFGTDQLRISSWDYRTTSKEDLDHSALHVLSLLIQFDRISDHRVWSYLDQSSTWSIRGYSSSIIDSSIDDLYGGHIGFD
jgi:hypothetical protein